MDLLFLACWTSAFILGAFLIWKHLINRIRVYLLMLLNLVFLATLFYLYPIVLAMSGN